MKKIFLFIVLSGMILHAYAQNNSGFEIVEKKELKRVDINWNGKLMTSYCYLDSIKKPFLFPLNTVDGITVTRGYPLAPRAGERTDHPHHVGSWMNYESVNGLDFWNHSTAIAPEKRDGYGTILHRGIISKKISKDQADIIVSADWIRPDGKILIYERTHFTFRIKDEVFFISRRSELRAGDIDVEFKDVKDGFFAVRVARELEMPSTQADVFVDAHGQVTNVPKSKSSDGVTGMYTSSEGLKGDSVWGTKGRWAKLEGKKDGKEITIGILDHPLNPGYPSYWHARGYGLFAINPLGKKIFSNGKEEMHLVIKPGKTVIFRYQLLIASGPKVTDEQMNQFANAFSKTE